MIKKSTTSFKKWIFIYFFIFVFVFLFISLTSLYFLQKSTTENDVKLEYENINSIITDKINSEAIKIRLFCDQLRRNDNVVDALKSKNLNELRKQTLPEYNTAVQDFKKFHLMFVDVDEVALLRMENSKIGDTINRKVLDKSIELGSSYFYIETGATMEADLRVAMPIFSDDEIIGYIVAGKPIKTIISELKEITHMDFLFLCKKAQINKVLWLHNNKDTNYSWNQFDSLVFHWTSLKHIDTIKSTELEVLLKSNEISDFTIGNNEYFSKVIPIKNFDQTTFGYLLVLHDFSFHYKDLKKNYLIIIFLSIVLIIILSFFINKVLNRTKTSLEDHEHKLKKELKRRILLEEKLNESVLELKQLTLIASHDLRGPITSLEGLIDIAIDEPDNNELRNEIIANAKISVQLMKKTIDSLTTIMQQKENLNEISADKILIEPVFSKVVQQIQHSINEKNISITSDFSKCTEFSINEIHLSSILMNLINNAIKYSSERENEQPYIEVSTGIINNNKVIYIKDNGVGLDLKIQKNHIFKPFKRFHHIGTGSGIGMYLTKMIVDNYKGVIEVESEVGKGTTIILKFKNS